MSTDPALGEYIPQAPINDEAKKANENLPGMGGVFNMVNFHLYHYAGNNPVKYVDPDGRDHRVGGFKWNFTSTTQKSVNIANLAKSYQGSTDWNFSSKRGLFGVDTNKCNKFVYDILTKAGASPGTPNGRLGLSPPTAEQWADPNFKIPGWEVLPEGETPRLGDIAAQAINYSDATGHVAIVTSDGKTTGTSGSATLNWTRKKRGDTKEVS